MKKVFISILSLVVAFILAIFINGTYYVFYGQEKSMAKLKNNQELRLYECCSIYTMHMAVWMFGWPLSPMAAHEAFCMHFKAWNDIRWHCDECFTNSKVITSNVNWEKKEPFKVSWPTDLTKIPKEELTYALAYNTKDTEVAFTQYGHPVLAFKVEYQNVKYNFGCIPVYTGLFQYLQKIGWLYPYYVLCCSATTFWTDILCME